MFVIVIASMQTIFASQSLICTSVSSLFFLPLAGGVGVGPCHPGPRPRNAWDEDMQQEEQQDQEDRQEQEQQPACDEDMLHVDVRHEDNAAYQGHGD